MDPSAVLGLFVGGRGVRMGGAAKGLLPAPDGGTLIERLLARAQEGAPGIPVVLVGRSEAYAHLGLPTLGDEPSGVGPLGGLRALLLRARTEGKDYALALSCDLPFISATLIRRLLHEAPLALGLAPRDGALWSPLTARYAVRSLAAVDAALASGEHSLQRVFARLGPDAHELVLSDSARSELRDWDSPADMNHR